MRVRKQFLFPCTLSISLILALILPDLTFVIANQQAQPSQSNEISNDNDFAEFEEFDEDDPSGHLNVGNSFASAQSGSPPASSDSPAGGHPSEKLNARQVESEPITEEDDDEDDDIFENIVQPKGKTSDDETTAGDGLKITRVPVHLRRNWDSYYVEIMLILGIVIYFINFITGRSKNETLANTWLDVNLDILESNFALVGDDGKKEIEDHGLLKDTESVFLLWCSGRSSVEGMLIEIRLWKRHDLLSVLTKLFKPVNDQVIFKLTLSQDSMDSYVFCLCNKKSASRLIKESSDLAVFCPERKSVEKFGINSAKFVIMNEIGEVSSFFFDQKITPLINKHEDVIDYIHISDQYSGPKASDLDPQPLKLPEVKRIIHIAFNCKDF